MKISKYDEDGISTNIIALFRGKNIIPFFGAGFTKGLRSKKGVVPDAAGLCRAIINVAVDKVDLNPEERTEIRDIQDLKTAFSLLANEQYVAKPQAKKMLESLFSSVDIPNDARRQVLQLNWPHIFTFNIDDAIERQTRELRKVLPNKPVSLEYIEANRCLIKIHGDIEEYLMYENPNLIFTWMDYLNSLEKNKTILSFFESIAKRSSYLFIYWMQLRCRN